METFKPLDVKLGYWLISLEEEEYFTDFLEFFIRKQMQSLKSIADILLKKAHRNIRVSLQEAEHHPTQQKAR
jgi:hypothetical protein